jgi:alcohol dehydrogenase class IV
MPWSGVHTFHCPTRIFFGRGASVLAAEQVGALERARPLVVSDPGVAAAGIVERVAGRLHEAGVEPFLYLDTEPNPTIANVTAAAALYREHGCDLLVGLGGGSAMDCAKGAGILIENGGEIGDYRGSGKVPSRIPPTICLPTTCGTGAEVTHTAVITDAEARFKIVCVTPNIAPDVALVDPDLVASAPPAVIAATAADALCHAVESYVNLGSDPLLNALTIAAVRMIGKNIRAGVHDQDPEAIAQLTLASTMAGIAFNVNANAIVHAASTPVTAHHDVPHGVANGIFLPWGLEFLAPACPDALREIAEALGEDVDGLSEAESAARCVQAIRRLMTDVGIPATLREWGLDPGDVDIPRLVEDAMKSRNVATNPRPVTADDIADLYERVLG